MSLSEREGSTDELQNCGFSSVFWTMVGMNIFTNLATILLFFLVRFCEKRYTSIADPATGEKLTEKNKKVDFKKVLEMPWPFWCMIAFTIFQTTTANVFSQNATELAEQRFNADSITAGWYTAVLQYAGFFFVPLLGVFIDIFGQRVVLDASFPWLWSVGLLLSRVRLLHLAFTHSPFLWARPLSSMVLGRVCGIKVLLAQLMASKSLSTMRKSSPQKNKRLDQANKNPQHVLYHPHPHRRNSRRRQQLIPPRRPRLCLLRLRLSRRLPGHPHPVIPLP